MSKPSSRAVQGLLRLRYSLHHHLTNLAPPLSRTHSTSTVKHSFPRPNPSSLASPNSPPPTSKFPSNGPIPTKPTSFTSPSTLGLSQLPSFSSRAAQISYGRRQFSLKAPEFGNFAKKILEKPASTVTSTFARYRGAIGLQIESFLKRNYLVLLGAGGVMVCAFLWRIMFGIANTFIGFSEGMAKYGFLALSAAIVAFAGLYVRARFTINPDRVYRIAMRMLNTHAGILEVMGAPLTGSELRAYVMSGGGVTLKKFKPRLRSKRCFIIFPIRGSERKGLVSIEVKKKNGQYDMKLVAVDIPMASGPDQRIFLVGDEEEYKVGGGLISMLRDPVLKAMAASKEFDDLDEIEEKEDQQRQVEEAERKHLQELQKLDNNNKQP